MTENEYMWAWLAYLGGAAVFFLAFWFWIRRIAWAEAKQLLLVLLSVVLFLPWYTDSDHSFLSPAWLISIADTLLYGADAFWRAGLPLLVGLCLALLLSTAYSLFCWQSQRKRQSSAKPAASP